jgi:hypothetical protein
MESDKSSTDANQACDEKCNKLTEKAQEEIARVVGINLKDLDNSEILTDNLRDVFSVVYDKSLEAFYRNFSESKFPQIKEDAVQSEASKILKKLTDDYKVKKLMDSSNSHKVAFVESFLSGLHDALMELCLEK